MENRIDIGILPRTKSGERKELAFQDFTHLDVSEKSAVYFKQEGFIFPILDIRILDWKMRFESLI